MDYWTPPAPAAQLARPYVAPSRDLTRTRWIAGLSVGVTVAAYVAFFAWDRTKSVDQVTGYRTGPFERWQVVGFIAVITAVVAVGAWIARSVWPALLVTWAAVVSDSVDWMQRPDNTLWPIASAMLAMAAIVGLGLVALVVTLVRRYAFPDGRTVEPGDRLGPPPLTRS